MIAVTVLAVLPMWGVFALTTPVATNISVAAALYLAVISPFAEEVVFRGFAFRQLYRHAAFGFWPSVFVTSIVFSLVHLETGSSAGQLIGIAAITFVGGGFFAWLFMRWGDNVFAPFVIHSLMNLTWQVFSVGETAFAGWLPTVMQGSVLVLAFVLTLVL
ncbi:MAG: CPBP family intramembrane metalloprotease [Acidobacteria bacterium]|nr:CPBP family intramembrane metalloprotease [Acidobacteriota bacterium]